MAKANNKVEESIVLTPEELTAIESRRKISENIESFKERYQALVTETGLTWVVDTSSPLNNMQLGIAKANS